MISEFEKLIQPKAGRTLIVGSRIYNGKEDRRKRYPDAIGVDMSPGEGVDVVADLERPLGERFAHIECMSVLEHCKRPWLMTASLEKMLEPGGTIFVTVPFIWRRHGYPDDYFRFTVAGVKCLFERIKWTHDTYSHRHLCTADDVPCVKAGEDWPYYARTEVAVFGNKL